MSDLADDDRGRPPTMTDVARAAGVSQQLVSLVMRDEPGPSQASRERVVRAAAELGYHPSASARLLRQRRTRLVGVAFVMSNSFQSDVVEQLFPALGRHGYQLAVRPVTPDRDVDLVISELMEQRVEALFVFNPDPTSPALLLALDRIPVVWLGERDPLGRSDNVHVDERAGLAEVVAHLASLGHRDISYAGGRAGAVGPDRRDAYVEAMRRVGLEAHVDVIEVGFEEEDGATAARTLLGRDGCRTTALVCCGDQAAAAALAVFSRHGVAVPGRISVVGFDDGRVAALSYNDLTSVRQDVAATAAAAAEIALSRLGGDLRPPRSWLVPAGVTYRSSVGPVPGESSS